MADPGFFDTMGNIWVFIFIGLLIWLYFREDTGNKS
jgi:hypothetical protein